MRDDANRRPKTRGGDRYGRPPRESGAPRKLYVVEGRLDENGGLVKFDRHDTGVVRVKRKYGDGGVVMAVAMLLLLVYLGGYVYMLLARESIPETEVVYGSIEPVEVFSGVIVRDETVFTSPASGVVVYYKSDYERIRANSVACSVHDETVVKKYLETLTNLENSILNAQGNRAQSAATENEIKSINAQLARQADSAALAAAALDTQALYDAAAKTEQLMNRRNQILLGDGRSGVKTLTQEYGIYQAQLDDALNEVTVPRSGIIGYKTDGYENVLTVAGLRQLTREDTLITVDYADIYTPSAVLAGDPVFKLVNSNTWYIAAYLPARHSENWQLEAIKTIYVYDGSGTYAPLETRIHSIDRLGQECYVVFRCNKRVTDFMNMRGVTFKIKDTLTEGLKIPNSAITEKIMLKIPSECVIDNDSVKQILKRNDTGGYDLITVSVFSNEPGYCCVLADYNDVSLYDVLAVPDTIGQTRQITELETVKGVFVTNTGSMVYKRIILSDVSSENTQYTIIDPAQNPSVKVKDRIVSDASLVEEK